MEFPTLFARAANGKVKQWSVQVLNDATVVSRHGYVNGKLTEAKRTVTHGKNQGRANATTALEQAVSEARGKYNKKLDEGYAEADERGADRADETLLPMLALEYRKRGRDIVFPCYVQPKLDGVRVVYHDGRLTSRNGKPFASVSHIAQELVAVPAVLDGELYSDKLSFQEIVGLVKKRKLSSDDIAALKHISLWVYDVITDGPFAKRHQHLKDMFLHRDYAHVKLLETETCDKRGDVQLFHDKYVARGYEGVMLRNADGIYRVNVRSKDLQKYKEFFDDEYKVVGYTEGEGCEQGLVIWTCVTQAGQRFNVRPRGTHQERARVFAHAGSYIGKSLTVRYQELTDDGVPRFPVGIAFRDYEGGTTVDNLIVRFS